MPHGQQHTATLPPLPGVAATSAGLPGLPPAPYLLSLVQETAAREAARWEAHVAALQEVGSSVSTPVQLVVSQLNCTQSSSARALLSLSCPALA